MKRTVLVVDDEQNMQAVMRMVLEGEAESSPMHLTCIGASERPHTDVRAGGQRNRGASPGMAGDCEQRSGI